MNRVALIVLAVILSLAACGKMKEKLSNMHPGYVSQKFLEAWQKKDWKGMYKYTHPNFISKLRQENLSPEESSMNDENLFINKLASLSKKDKNYSLKTYSIKIVPIYKKGDTTVWVDAEINGKKKKIPLTLHEMALKVDITNIK